MSATELLIDRIDGRLYAAVTRKGVVTDLYTDSAKPNPTAWASIFMGRVAKIDRNLDAAFVDLGNGLTGFLPAKHVHFRGADASESRSGIADLLQPGQAVLVQVKSEAKNTSEHEQHKLPRLTTKLYIQGQFLVYCPLANQVTMSRHIQDERTLAISTRIKGKGGWIVLQNAEKAEETAIHAEAAMLQDEWMNLMSERNAQGDTPRLLRAGPNALHRVLLDYSDLSFDHIHAADRDIFGMMEKWCEKFNKPLATSKRLRLYKPEKPGQRLFDIYDIYATIEDLQDSHVHLPSGGSLIIEPTHALVVIDVNQGSTGSIIEANNEAAIEIARQVRLRNLSGAVLVDFIGLSQRAERMRLMEIFEKVFKGDYALAQVHGFTRIGIVEMTRKRRTAMYFEKIAS